MAVAFARSHHRDARARRVEVAALDLASAATAAEYFARYGCLK